MAEPVRARLLTDEEGHRLTQIAAWNQNPRPFIWNKIAEEILESLAR
jgi:hypothetical protein